MCASCEDAYKHKRYPEQQEVKERCQYAPSKNLIVTIGWHD